MKVVDKGLEGKGRKGRAREGEGWKEGEGEGKDGRGEKGRKRMGEEKGDNWDGDMGVSSPLTYLLLQYTGSDGVRTVSQR